VRDVLSKKKILTVVLLAISTAQTLTSLRTCEGRNRPMELIIETNTIQKMFGSSINYNVKFQNVSFEEMKTLMTVYDGIKEERKQRLEEVSSE
jgi:hypothetical protein